MHQNSQSDNMQSSDHINKHTITKSIIDEIIEKLWIKLGINSENSSYLINLAYWTLEECKFISLSIAPHLIAKKNPKRVLTTMRLSLSYARVSEQLKRAYIARILQNEVSPDDFVLWAKNNGISIPEPIISALEYKAHSQTDLQNSSQSASESEFASDTKKNNQQKAATARSDISLYKILYAVATLRYKFDPDKRNSPSPSMIKAEVERCGLTIDEATIKKHLTKAAETIKEIKSIN